MKKFIYIIIYLCCYSTILKPEMYTITEEAAVHIVSKVTPQTFVFVNIDEPSLHDIYVQDFNPILKKIHKSMATKMQESSHALSYINMVMKNAYPLYALIHQQASHAIGITRRSLRWAHLVRATIIEQGAQQESTRYLFAIEKINAQPDDAFDFVELNSGVFFIDKADIAKVITNYIATWNNNCAATLDNKNMCYGIIYIDRCKENIETSVELLTEQFPTIKTVGLHVT